MGGGRGLEPQPRAPHRKAPLGRYGPERPDVAVEEHRSRVRAQLQPGVEAHGDGPLLRAVIQRRPSCARRPARARRAGRPGRRRRRRRPAPQLAVRSGRRSRGSGAISSVWPISSHAARSAPCAAPRTWRSTISVNGKSASPPSRTPSGTATSRGAPVARRHGCGGQPQAGIGAQRARVLRGQDDPPAGPVGVGVRAVAAARGRARSDWRSGSDDQQREAPDALAHASPARRRRAGRSSSATQRRRGRCAPGGDADGRTSAGSGAGSGRSPSASERA